MGKEETLEVLGHWIIWELGCTCEAFSLEGVDMHQKIFRMSFSRK